MEQTLVDDIVSILENYSVHNDFDGFLKVPTEEVSIALEKMFITKMNEEKRKIYYEKIESLKTILHEEYLPEAILERNFYLDNGKVISRIWIEKLNVSLNNRNYWPEIFEFFSETMSKFELFFFEFEEIEDQVFAELEDDTSNEIDDMVHVRVNFPPFQHFKIDENNKEFIDQNILFNNKRFIHLE